MEAEIRLYGPITSDTASLYISLFESNKSNDLTVRVNTPGGEVFAAWGVIIKYQEHAKGKNLKVDGRADSGGAFLCCYAPHAVCHDISLFLFHRAAYPAWVEGDPNYFTDDMKNALIKVNRHLRNAMESKFTAKKWKEVTGVSLDELFSLDSRIDVTIDANQAKELGLVNEVITITPEKKAEVQSLMELSLAAQNYFPTTSTGDITPEVEQPLKTNKMTIDKLKTEHPEVYDAIFNKGVTTERDRVCALMAYVSVDAALIAENIKKGEQVTTAFMAEMNVKMFSAGRIAEVKADTPEAIATTDVQPPQPEAQAKVEDFEKRVKANLNL
jgi:ATP-dependent Clp protease protease subunit